MLISYYLGRMLSICIYIRLYTIEVLCFSQNYLFAAPLCYTCFDLEGEGILTLILLFWCHSCLTILTILKSSESLFNQKHWGNQQGFQHH